MGTKITPIQVLEICGTISLPMIIVRASALYSTYQRVLVLVAPGLFILFQIIFL
jgi:hypothetical protein|nr:MAG TPA: hypothetical protein [Caudoviricetes sp.]